MRKLAAAAALFLAAPAAAQGLELAITVDDLPVHGPLPPGETRESVARDMLAALKAAGVPEAYGFLNGKHLETVPETEKVLSDWRAAGYPLGNHTWSHPNLNDLSAAEYEAEIARNEPLLERLSRGRNWRWFRYPFLSEGKDPAKRAEIRRYLDRRGYRIAAATMTYWDYEWNEAYARCRAARDEAALARMESAYLEAVKLSIDYWRRAAWAAYGRDIPYVLVAHISPMNARMFPQVLNLYRSAGFRFTTLKRAQRHPAYREDMDPSLPPGLSLEQRAAERGLRGNRRYNPEPLLNTLCRPLP